MVGKKVWWWKNVKPSIISNVYEDIRGFEEIDVDDAITIDSDEETNINKSDTDEEIEMVTPPTTTAIGPPIESGKELRCEVRGIDIGQELVPGRTWQQTRDAIQLVEENFDNFYRDCALMSAVTNMGQKLSRSVVSSKFREKAKLESGNTQRV